MKLGDVMLQEHPGGVSAKASRKSKTIPSVLRRLEIEPADNGGYTVIAYHRPKNESKTSGPFDFEPKRSVFEDRASMIKHIDTCLGDCDA